MLNRMMLCFITVFCLVLSSGCSKNKEKMIVARHNQAMVQICEVINSINDKKTAEEAIPKLKDLAESFSQAKKDYLEYQKENPGFEKKYIQEMTHIMLEWGKALSKFNTNEQIPKELREEIIKIVSL